jgi:hypothetical protein
VGKPVSSHSIIHIDNETYFVSPPVHLGENNDILDEI